MAITVAKLAEYMEHGLNILISGPGGTGKTQMLMEATKKVGFTMDYLSAPTLDPYVDIIGVPIPSEPDENGKRMLEFLRRKGLLNAEVVFIDELNRAEPKTLNAIFEMIQFFSVNGEKLPNLKVVVAAINPVGDDYVGNYELDFSLSDRFDIYLETDGAADLGYFVNVFGPETGKALVDWHRRHDHKEKGYLSPRRLEKIGRTWLKLPNIGTLKDMMPPRGDFDVNLLQRALQDSVKKLKVKADPNASLAETIGFLSDAEVRKRREEIIAELPNMSPEEVTRVTEAVARSLMKAIQIPTIIRDWAPVLEWFSPADKTMMMSTWGADRCKQFLKLLVDNQISVGKNLIPTP